MGADRKIIKEWLDKADEDFGFASACLNDTETSYFNLICFHFQQAVEKYLKAYVVAKGLKFEKIHNLKVLLQTCQKEEAGFSNLLDDCVYLDGFYIESRYPVDMPVGADRIIAQKAQGSAKKIGDFVKTLLKAG